MSADYFFVTSENQGIMITAKMEEERVIPYVLNK